MNKDIYQAYNSRWWFYIRELVLQRDEYTCQKCKLKNKKLSVHHIDQTGQRDYIKNIIPNNKSENLMTLCSSCHAKSHTLIDFKESI